MITEAILNFLHGLAVSVFAWAKDATPDAPAWIADMNGAVDTVVGMIPAGVLWFIPVVPVVQIGLTLVGLLVVLGLVLLGRRVLSLFTGGGGNA